MDYLLSKNLLLDNQFGFLQGRSTCTQLLAALNKWYNSYDLGINIHIVYTDISRAFNTVSHTKLLSVFKSYGIANNTSTGYVLSSQTDTNVFVLIMHYQSLVVFCQAVCLDIFINNLTVSCYPKHAVSGMFLCADDAKLFSADSNYLQQSLTSVISRM